MSTPSARQMRDIEPKRFAATGMSKPAGCSNSSAGPAAGRLRHAVDQRGDLEVRAQRLGDARQLLAAVELGDEGVMSGNIRKHSDEFRGSRGSLRFDRVRFHVRFRSTVAASRTAEPESGTPEPRPNAWNPDSRDRLRDARRQRQRAAAVVAVTRGDRPCGSRRRSPPARGAAARRASTVDRPPSIAGRSPGARPRAARPRAPAPRSRSRRTCPAGRTATFRTLSRLMRLAVMLAMQPDANVTRAFAMSTFGVSTGTPTASTPTTSRADRRPG